MLFNSFTFWIFYLLVAFFYCRLKHKAQNKLLLVASYFFYGFWNWKFLGLVWISTLVDYFAANKIDISDNKSSKKKWLCLSILTNLSILGFFKYYNFFISEFLSLTKVIGLTVSLPIYEIALPVGISFFTFQTMSYTIDVYRGNSKPAKSFSDFALFVCFFPQLVAGPIERYDTLMPQILNPRKKEENDFSIGLYHVILGLFKKVVVADNLSLFVDAIYSSNPSQITGLDCLIGTYAFAFQIYCDFSGYSSIAQGIAKWIGFDLSFNFKMPYFSKSPSDFWQRWHITLSSWLRDYLYIPLGGNRRGKLLTVRNLMLTMLIGGLWHGAGWAFIAWGGFHGLLLCTYRYIVPADKQVNNSNIKNKLIGFLQRIIFFNLICIAWIFFRSNAVLEYSDLGYAISMISRIFTDWTIGKYTLYGIATILFYAGPMMLFEYWIFTKKNKMLMLLEESWIKRTLIYSYFIIMIWFFSSEDTGEFIYFQF